MFESIVKELKNDFALIKILLANNSESAEKVLTKAAQGLKDFMEYSEYSIFIQNYETHLIELIDMFVEASMEVSFATTYKLIDAYREALVANNTTKAAQLLQRLEDKVTFMNQSYLDAMKSDRSQTPAFIDFKRDISYLLRHLENSKKEAVMQQICTNFEKAMNFRETQQQFFYHPHKNCAQISNDEEMYPGLSNK